MNQTYDPVTSALTGHLTFFLLLAAILTWPIAMGLLALYARAVRRSMGSRSTRPRPVETPDPPRPSESASGAPPVAAMIVELPATSLAPDAERLTTRLIASPRQAAIVYILAGVAYAVVMAVAQLVASNIEILPLRLAFYVWTFGWPIVPTVAIVGSATRRAKFVVVSTYLCGLVILGAIGISRSPDLTWLQVFLPWFMYDLPATALLVTYLSRRVRAVGPLVLTFLLLAFIGSDVAVSIAGTNERYLRAVITVAQSVGLGGSGAFWTLQIIGFLLFAILGWVALAWIRRRYQSKHLSDESLTIDAIWLLFTIAFSADLSFEHPAWTLAGPVAFAVFAIVARLGFGVLSRRTNRDARSPTLLVLRSFSIGHDSERLFDVIGRHWRRVGSIQMIAGIDLVSRTVEPHEFLDFVSGKLSRRFIDGEDTFGIRLRERDLAADRDLRFRVNEFFCYADTWKMVLTNLVHESDAVLMDLRGFSKQNAGCVFELKELARVVPLDRVVFIVDGRTDEKLLAETLGGSRAGVFRLASTRHLHTRPLMRALAGAVASTTVIRP